MNLSSFCNLSCIEELELKSSMFGTSKKDILKKLSTVYNTYGDKIYLVIDGHFAWFFKAAGCIPVDRSKKDNNATSLALEVLKEGKALGLFPEGTRNKTDKFLLPFKFGAVSMASKTNALIVPFGITGDYKFRSKNLTVRFGKPFKVEGDLEEANKKLEKEVEKLMRESMK